MIHIGQQIKEVVEAQKMHKNELSRRLNMSATNIHKVFKRETIDTGLLQKLSEVLQHNFFTYYAEALPALPGGESAQKNIKAENESLQKENAYLKEINELLREKTGKQQQ